MSKNTDERIAELERQREKVKAKAKETYGSLESFLFTFGSTLQAISKTMETGRVLKNNFEDFVTSVEDFDDMQNAEEKEEEIKLISGATQ